MAENSGHWTDVDFALGSSTVDVHYGMNNAALLGTIANQIRFTLIRKPALRAELLNAAAAVELLRGEQAPYMTAAAKNANYARVVPVLKHLLKDIPFESVAAY